MPDRICVAQIGGAHGIRGEFKLKSFTADPTAVGGYGPLETEDGTANLEIETMRPVKGHLVARFRGVNDRNAAERLTNLRLFVSRARLPPPAADEFYHVDLIGLDAVDSVQLDDDTLIVLSSNVGALQATLPRLAVQLDVRLTGVVPLDDSLESVFSYLVET